MSSHLRHCPKHRKPLPCAHCALSTPIIQPNTLPGFVSDELKCEYHLYKGVWICLYCSHQGTAADASRACSVQNIERVNKKAIGKELDAKYAKKERRAAAARTHRKAKADQLAAIKEALKTPIATIKEAAKAKADAEQLPSMNQGKYMSDAPTGKGALVYKPAGKIDQICAVISRSESLGSPTIDHETGEAFFADNDRQRIAPEGVGAPSDEKPEIGGLSRKGFTYSGEESERKFQVKLDGPEYQSGLSAAVDEYTFQEESETFCRLCQQAFQRIENHFTQAHGDPLEPGHIHRFGDVIQEYVRKINRQHAKLEKAGREAALEITSGKKATAEIDAIKAGYVRLNGEWIPKGTA